MITTKRFIWDELNNRLYSHYHRNKVAVKLKNKSISQAVMDLTYHYHRLKARYNVKEPAMDNDTVINFSIYHSHLEAHLEKA